MRNKLLSIIVGVLVLIGAGVQLWSKDNTANISGNADETYDLAVHYIDVGQGDCELICLPNGQHMLIDCGNNENGDEITDYLSSLSISKIDYLVGTHPHADHIGGMDTVIKGFDIGEVYMPRASSTSKTFEDVLDAIDEKNLTVNEAKAGVNIYNDALLSIDIIAPLGSGYESLNDYSAVILLKYKDSSFMFTGDAESVSEKEMLQSATVLSADVLKVGHHGSSSSSKIEFLNAVNPSFAVISCGVNNQYSHPHKETLDNLSEINAIVYRTDTMGTIICRTDGENYFWECEKQ